MNKSKNYFEVKTMWGDEGWEARLRGVDPSESPIYLDSLSYDPHKHVCKLGCQELTLDELREVYASLLRREDAVLEENAGLYADSSLPLRRQLRFLCETVDGVQLVGLYTSGVFYTRWMQRARALTAARKLLRLAAALEEEANNE